MATTENGTYYPDDYTKKADVPGDMKKMAESIDANKVQKIEGKGLSTNDFTNEYKQKLDGLENYDDTDIKKDISDIKEEQENQNEKIETNTTKNKEQDELISKLKSALINVETEEAKSLHIEDASEVPAQLKVMGNQEQKTREGYNLLENTAVTQTINGITFTVNDDGTVTVNGTATAQAVLKINQTLILENGNYKLNGCPEGGSSSTYRFRLYRTNTNAIPDIGSGAFFEITENIKFNYLDMAIEEGTKISNLVFKPMIIKGTEEKLYEPYGAMPSPDYSSEIKCLGSNKNLFDEDNYIENLTINTDGTFKDDSSFKIIKIPVKSNTVYTLSRSAVEESTANIVYGTSDVEPSANATCTYKILRYNITEIQIETTENTKYICIRKTKANTDYRLFVDFKIEEGDTATSYSPFGQGSTKISKINNLSNFSTLANGLSSGTYYGLTFEMLNKFSCKISGKPSANELRFGNTYNSKNILISLEQGKHYKVKNSFNNVSEITLVNSKNNTYRLVYVANKGEIPLQEGDDGISSVRLYLDTNTTYDNEIVTCLIYTQEDDDFIPEQTDYILNIQQEMLEGDYFVKEADGWKEVHNYLQRSIKEDIINATMSGSGRYIVIGSIIANTALIPNANEIPRLFSNISPACSYNTLVNTNDIDYGITISTSGSLCIINKDWTTLDEYKNKLSNDDFYYYYCLATPTKLPCTSEQSAVLDELNNLNLFDGVNNIITAENIALLKLKYVADTKTYVDKEISDIKEQLNTINELLSTTATSSLLLDNLQNDLESEVM